MPTITAFASSPDRGRGMARDMTVRWALEEVGLSYDVRLLGFAEMKEPDHLALQPFGQIPTLEEGDLRIFESGAIVLEIAGKHAGLLPADGARRARAIAWMFAAHATVEPPITELESARFHENECHWQSEHVAMVEDRIARRLEQLSGALGARDWLEGEFTSGDLLMVQVLRRIAETPLLGRFPDLVSYVARGESRPAFRRAYEAQAEVFRRLTEHV